jgi:hypothetical protein
MTSPVREALVQHVLDALAGHTDEVDRFEGLSTRDAGRRGRSTVPHDRIHGPADGRPKQLRACVEEGTDLEAAIAKAVRAGRGGTG